MDSVTQIALGASIAAAVGLKPFGRKVLLVGALLGTLPDLDVFIDYGNAIDNYTQHRGFSHSLFVLTALSVLLYFIMLKLKPPLRQHKLALLLVILLPLITHPLLDTFTTYGTQLLWPISSPPIAWHSIFIIDPLYTLPLLISVIFLWFSANTQRWLSINKVALVVSCAYLAWGQLSQTIITDRVKQDPLVLNSPLLVMPTPFNTIYWRVMSYQEDNYYEAFTHLGDKAPLQWHRYANNRYLVKDSQPDYLPRLEWFSHGWLRFDERDGQLQITDLRLGVAGYHPFTFVIAEQAEQQQTLANWQSIEPLQLPRAKVSQQQLLTEMRDKLGLTFNQE
ncbi:metal-dependent hydrolase [Agarivorans sp. MS3-6]|uniref:metal-dependent hydrolase n=1 Tax=Agarivorans sp. TSD2052 TaxID=2937286 RepID=UPI00200FE214|nr:metal-dependent hydrolase [Agarivorans sp. TSD2052]UPW17063.1 metal-dependent hydrolase [Agarivorans sp. TSD2052]